MDKLMGTMKGVMENKTIMDSVSKITGNSDLKNIMGEGNSAGGNPAPIDSNSLQKLQSSLSELAPGLVK